MAVHARLESLGSDEERSSGRERLLLHAKVDLAEGGIVSAPILNISLTGLLLKLESKLRLNSEISFEIAKGVKCVARVVWSSAGLHGCTFEKPISRSDLKKVQVSSPVVWPRFTAPSEGSHLRNEYRVSKSTAVRSHGTAAAAIFPTEFQDYEQQVHSLSAGQRLQIIFGLAVATWAAIGLLTWQLLG